MIRLSVVQQPPNAPALAADAVIWRTCVRQVAFVDEPTAIPQGVPAWHDEAAYAHLLEVVCGLHSPIVGETEVLHQFKVFADGLSTELVPLRDLCTRLLADARTVRARHLIGLGSRSYGSAVRRYVRDRERVAIVGTGVLAREIVPFLVRPDRVLDLWGRRAECSIAAPGLDLPFAPISALCTDRGTVGAYCRRTDGRRRGCAACGAGTRVSRS